MPHGADVLSLAFDPRGELVATGSGDNTARLWNARTGEPVGAQMKHGGPVRMVTFDRLGRFLATGSLDGTARLWNARTGEPIGEPMQHAGPVWDVAFDPKGKLLATGSLDDTARLWLALSTRTLFERGRTILGPERQTGFVSSSLEFLSWAQEKSIGAVEYARSFVAGLNGAPSRVVVEK
jgi:WD40 repeat protein